MLHIRMGYKIDGLLLTNNNQPIRKNVKVDDRNRYEHVKFPICKKVGEDMHEISGDLDGTITFVRNGGLPPHKKLVGIWMEPPLL